MDEYIKKETLLSIIEHLPVAEFIPKDIFRPLLMPSYL